MPSPTSPPADLVGEHVMTLTVQTGQAAMVPQGAQGSKGLNSFTGGTFAGPRLDGTVWAGGGDFFLVRPSGSLRLDVRLVLACSDGAYVLMFYGGTAVPDSSTMKIRVAPYFEAPDGPHAWLNDIQCVGRGQLIQGGVRFDVWALS